MKFSKIEATIIRDRHEISEEKSWTKPGWTETYIQLCHSTTTSATATSAQRQPATVATTQEHTPTVLIDPVCFDIDSAPASSSTHPDGAKKR